MRRHLMLWLVIGFVVLWKGGVALAAEASVEPAAGSAREAADARTMDQVVNELKAQGLSEQDARQLAEQATTDVMTGGDRAERSEGAAPTGRAANTAQGPAGTATRGTTGGQAGESSGGGQGGGSRPVLGDDQGQGQGQGRGTVDSPTKRELAEKIGGGMSHQQIEGQIQNEFGSQMREAGFGQPGEGTGSGHDSTGRVDGESNRGSDRGLERSSREWGQERGESAHSGERRGGETETRGHTEGRSESHERSGGDRPERGSHETTERAGSDRPERSSGGDRQSEGRERSTEREQPMMEQRSQERQTQEAPERPPMEQQPRY